MAVRRRRPPLDNNVLAIKQTLYRTGVTKPHRCVRLVKAADAGKQGSRSSS